MYCLCSTKLTKKRTSSIGKRAGMQVLGPGFDSQVPHFFHNIFINMLLCSVPSKDYHTTLPPSLPRAQEVSSNGQDMQLTMDASQPRHTQFWKVKKGLNLLGLIASKTPFGSRHPQGLLNLFIIFLSLFIFFFYSFNCYFD